MKYRKAKMTAPKIIENLAFNENSMKISKDNSLFISLYGVRYSDDVSFIQ